MAAPLQGVLVLERARGVAAAYAGRMLSTLGAEVVMLEPPGGGELRREPPFLPGGTSATFAYLSANKKSVIYDPTVGATGLAGLVRNSAILIDDTPVADRVEDWRAFRDANPSLVLVSVLPFGASGPKAGWKGEEINLIHASGEANLLPNGLTLELFPGRPPLKIYGNFVSYQAGVAAAMAALAALLSVPFLGGQEVDVSIQEVAVSLALMAVQRLGDGVLEHRSTRSFRYGGVFACADGHVELITAEEHQWAALVDLLGRPDWADEPAFSDPIERGRRGAEINARLHLWAKNERADEIVALGQSLGVPIAKYRQPRDVLTGDHERSRGLFSSVPVQDAGALPMLVAPMQLDGAPLVLSTGSPELGADQAMLAGGDEEEREAAA